MEPSPTVVNNLNKPTTFTLTLEPPPTGQHYRPFDSLLPYEDPRPHLEDALKRSITVVFWYKPDSAPIRLHGEVTTFPLFQLSQFAHLAADLGLAPAAYIDAYNPYAQAWEQQTINAVRAVESEQRLLFRVRKSLLEGLDDSECPSLAEEIRLQPQPRPSKRRSSSDGSTLMGPPLKYARVETPPPPPPPGPDLALASSPVPLNMSTPFVAVDPSASGPSRQSSADGEGATSTLLTFQTLPLVKRWPNDYTVFELSAGFRQMDVLVAQQPSLTQRTAFERVFGCRYVKSTVCRHRGVWRRAPKDLRETFERMGQDERGLWSEFIKRIEGGTGRTDTVRGKRQLAAAAEAGASIANETPVPHEGETSGSEHKSVLDTSCLPPDAGEDHAASTSSSHDLGAPELDIPVTVA